ncbi:MAG TPA: hypothetical protein VK212_06140 [Lentimicrobium sp.]|nr:hypothetical protein [Lentimicrobium sp.]
MKCKEVRIKIMDVAGVGDLSNDEELMRHLSNCKECAFYFNKYFLAINSLKLDVKSFSPNPFLKDIILERTILNPTKVSVLKHPTSTYLLKSVIKFSWSVTIAAASVFMGILLGNISTHNADIQNEKESYIQEISMNSSDLTGINDNVLSYFDIEQNDENGE